MRRSSRVAGEQRFGFTVLAVHSASVANAIAAVALELARRTGAEVHVYFDWTESNPLSNLLRFVFLGVGEVAAVTREVVRRAKRRPDRDRACTWPEPAAAVSAGWGLASIAQRRMRGDPQP